jgi:hypothetical protein
MVGDSGITLEHEVFSFSYQCREPVGQVVTGVHGAGKEDCIYIAGVEHGRVQGVCGGGGEGLEGVSIAGNDFYYNIV